MTGVVTVADLLNRNAPVHVKIDGADDVTHGISVGSLLRREGRAPHAIDRPIQPRAHQQFDEADDEQATGHHKVLVRRGAIAAGTLLAAGSVFGAAVLTDVAPTAGTDAETPTVGGSYPGQGVLDVGGQPPAPAGTVQLDQASVSNPLDPGTPAPTSWIPVAFPSALAGVPTGVATAASTAEAVGQAAGVSGADLVAGAESGGTGTSGTSGVSGSNSTPPAAGSGGSSDAGGSGATRESQTVVGDLGNGLDDAADGVGGAVGGPLGGTVDGVGDTLNNTTDTLDSAVGGLLGGGDDSDDNDRSARSFSAESSDSSDDSSSSSAPQDEDSSDDGGDSGRSSGGLLNTVGDLAGGLLG